MTDLDLEYKELGLFTMFLPNTKAGEEAWKAIAEQTEGTGKIFTMYLKSTLSQLRKAGYKVGKAKKATMSINNILKELKG